MIDNKEIKYIETEIADWMKHLDHISHQSIMHTAYSETVDDEHSDAVIIRGLEHLYNHICAYFEARSMNAYLARFTNKFDPYFINKEKLLSSSFIRPDDTAPELEILNEFRQFLSPFPAFDYSAKKSAEQDNLLSILKETPFILKKLLAPSKLNEAAIYNQVHWVLKLYYHECKLKRKATFMSIFKMYEPDILIPELKTAIEFKLVRRKSNIDEYIDQVKVDATNYKDDTRYTNFIAVLCIQDRSIATEKNILSAWNSKEFPANWSLVIAFI